MYSQRDEEIYILQACKDVARRRLLDIGAWDSKTFSNSRALIEQGWGGVLIEPSPGPLRNLIRAYVGDPEVIVLAAAVACEPGLVMLQITDDSVSTSDAGQFDVWKSRTDFLGPMFIQALTIQQILERFGSFDFVSIDTEGSSIDLLKVMLATEMFPRCICAEHNGRDGEAIMAAQSRGYKLVYRSEENVVFSL
jgi:FkbM family methyltransferase